MLSAACLIGTVLLTSRLAASPALAVYALSFWHYLFYWWAYRHGAVQPARFRRDAVLMKSVALTALASVYVPQSSVWITWISPISWISWISVLAIGAGFMLNLAAARALGHARTYYGWELGELPPQRVTSFPYSVIPHPMLVGNMLAFGATLLEPGFRKAWWPLAVIHVALNCALLVMETSATGVVAAGAALVAAAFAAGVAVLLESPDGWVPVAVVFGASAAYAYARRGLYVIRGRSYERSDRSGSAGRGGVGITVR
jgi:protein-S-isoprenylcysteine O-methyltransferase Ste14